MLRNYHAYTDTTIWQTRQCPHFTRHNLFQDYSRVNIWIHQSSSIFSWQQPISHSQAVSQVLISNTEFKNQDYPDHHTVYLNLDSSNYQFINLTENPEIMVCIPVKTTNLLQHAYHKSAININNVIPVRWQYW